MTKGKRLYSSKLIPALVLLMLLGSLTSCSKAPAPADEPAGLPDKAGGNVITFVTINSPNTYYVNEHDDYAGLEYELAQLFVQSLGPPFSLKFVVVDSFAKVIPALLNNKADIGAADITITTERKKIIDYSVPYHDVQQQLAYNRDKAKPPKKLADLEGKLLVIPSGTSFVERVSTLSVEHPSLAWREVNHTNSEQLIENLANAEIEYTIADSHLLAVMQNYYPNIGMAFPLGEPEKIAWAMAKGSNPKLLSKINGFFKKIKADGTLRNLIDRYHGNTKRLNPLDVKTFLARSQTLLPKYTRLFKNAQDSTDIDWRLLAAMSYQESHWDTFSTSPTNVRGLMMLTEATSDMMKVTDRLDPAQSIPAGAKYLLWIKDRLPTRIPEPDRTFMALAAYNIGVGHVEDGRVLAQRLKLNPDRWADVKSALLKLNDPDYYMNAKHGYCSCGAPIVYTESIRSYYQILLKHQPSHNPDLEPFKIAAQ